MDSRDGQQVSVVPSAQVEEHPNCLDGCFGCCCCCCWKMDRRPTGLQPGRRHRLQGFRQTARPGRVRVHGARFRVDGLFPAIPALSPDHRTPLRLKWPPFHSAIHSFASPEARKKPNAIIIIIRMIRGFDSKGTTDWKADEKQ